MADSWFLLFNTQRAGCGWLDNFFRHFTDVAVRLNINPLDELLSLRGRTIKRIETVKYRSGHERIATHSLEYGPADLFWHVEDNTDVGSIALLEAYSVSLFLNIIANNEQQGKALKKKDFRCANLIMNPVKSIDSNVRGIARNIQSENSKALDLNSIGQSLYPHDHVLFSFLKRIYRVEKAEDVLFLVLLLHLSYKLAEDLFLAEQFEIPVLKLEKMISEPSYLASILPTLMCGKWAPSKEEIAKLQSKHMDAESELFWLNLGRDKSKKSENNSLESYLSEPKRIYESMPEWRRDCISFIFYVYHIFDLYESHGYDLSWARSSNPYPASSCEKILRFDPNQMLLNGMDKSLKPFNVAMGRNNWWG